MLRTLPQYLAASVRAMLLLSALILVPVFAAAQDRTGELQIKSPDGGQLFEPGDTVEIRFSIDGLFTLSNDDTVAIELSTDNGGSWSTLFLSMRDFSFRDTVVRWIVPQVSSSQCRLRIVQRSGVWGFGRALTERSIPVIPRDSLWEAVFRPSDSLLVINAMDRVHIVNPWDTAVPVRTIFWPYPLPYRRLVNVRFGRGDSLLLLGVIPNGGGHDHMNGPLKYGALDFYTGDSVFMFNSWASAGYRNPTRGGHSVDLSADVRRVLRTHYQGTDVFDLFDGSVLVWVPEDTNDYRRRMHGSSEFSPDEKYVAAGGQFSLSVRDAETFDVVWERFDVDADQISYSHDGQYLLVTPFIEEPLAGGDFNKQEHRILDAMTGDTILTHSIQIWRNGYPQYVHGAFASASNAYVLDFRVFSDFEKPYPRAFTVPATSSAAITPSGSYYADVTSKGRLIIRDMGLTSQPGDTIAGLFSISSSVPIAVNQFVGTVVVDQSHDTTVSGFLINPGKNPVRVESIGLTEGDLADFSLITNTGPFELQPNGRAELGIRFTPSDTGVRRATVTVETENGSTQAEIQGIGTRTVSVESFDAVTSRGLGLSVSIQPNPAAEQALVTIDSDRRRDGTIVLYDAMGRAVVSRRVHLAPGESTTRLGLDKVPSGSYLCVVASEEGHRRSLQIVIVR